MSPTAFFQTNVAAAEALVQLVIAAIPIEASTILDLYAGVGLFALPACTARAPRDRHRGERGSSPRRRCSAPAQSRRSTALPLHHGSR